MHRCEDGRQKRGVSRAALLFLFVCFSASVFAEQGEANKDSNGLPRVSVFSLRNSEDEERYKNLSESITETIVLNLELIGEYEIIPPPEDARNPEEEKDFIRDSKVANVVFGRLEIDEEGQIVIEVSVYDGRVHRERASFREIADGFLETFKSSDRLVASLLGAFTDREIAYGNIEFISEGVQVPYTVLIDDKEAKPSEGQISRILTGTYRVRVVQQRPMGEAVFFDSSLEVQRNTTEQVRFRIPQFTEGEYETLRRLEEKWRSLLGIDSQRALSALQEAIAFSEGGDQISPAMGRFRRRHLALFEEISGGIESTGGGNTHEAPRVLTSYSSGFSADTARTETIGRFPSASFTAERVVDPAADSAGGAPTDQAAGAPTDPGFSSDPAADPPKSASEKSSPYGLVIAAGGGVLFDVGVIRKLFSKRLQMSLLTGFSCTSRQQQLLASLSARATFVLFPDKLSPSFSLWATTDSNLVFSDGVAVTSGPSLGIEIPLWGSGNSFYFKNNIGIKLYPSDFSKLYYLPSVGIKR